MAEEKKGIVAGIGKAVTGAADLAGDCAKLAKEAIGGQPTKDTRNEMFKKICAIIPNQINNQTVLNVLDMMRKEQKLLMKNFESHLKTNEANIKKHADSMKKANGYVEDQNAWTDVAYGDATMQYSGCEIFATYNAIYNITGKHDIPLQDMISHYEKDGMVLSGKFGTAPKAIKDFLDKQGYKTEMAHEEADFEPLAKKCKTMIMTMYNNKDDISKEVHTVNISKENGKYTAHNVYCNGKVVGPADSLTELMKSVNGGKAKIISLIGIL